MKQISQSHGSNLVIGVRACLYVPMCVCARVSMCNMYIFFLHRQLAALCELGSRVSPYLIMWILCRNGGKGIYPTMMPERYIIQ